MSEPTITVTTITVTDEDGIAVNIAPITEIAVNVSDTAQVSVDIAPLGPQGPPGFLILTWNGSDYIPTAYKTLTTIPREFRGSVDPSTVTGVVVAQYDTWIQV